MRARACLALRSADSACRALRRAAARSARATVNCCSKSRTRTSRRSSAAASWAAIAEAVATDDSASWTEGPGGAARRGALAALGGAAPSSAELAGGSAGTARSAGTAGTDEGAGAAGGCALDRARCDGSPRGACGGSGTGATLSASAVPGGVCAAGNSSATACSPEAVGSSALNASWEARPKPDQVAAWVRVPVASWSEVAQPGTVPGFLGGPQARSEVGEAGGDPRLGVRQPVDHPGRAGRLAQCADQPGRLPIACRAGGRGELPAAPGEVLGESRVQLGDGASDRAAVPVIAHMPVIPRRAGQRTGRSQEWGHQSRRRPG